MKKAIIFHSMGSNPDEFWYGWLKTELEKAGYKVSVPHYPAINQEPIEQFLPKVLAGNQFDSETVLVGHSAGCPLILSILEAVDVKVAQAILVAGFAEHPDDQTPDPILQTVYNWSKIKQNVDDIIFINSVDDPWNCTDKQGRLMFDHLGGTQIIRKEGHFGSGKFNQPYPQFPLLKALILGASV